MDPLPEAPVVWYCLRCPWMSERSVTRPAWCPCCGNSGDFTTTPPQAETP